MNDKTEQCSSEPKARLATLDQVIDWLANFIEPIPTKETVRCWLDDANVPRFKSNPTARRGGGRVYYSVAGVEKLLRSRTFAGKLRH